MQLPSLWLIQLLLAVLEKSRFATFHGAAYHLSYHLSYQHRLIEAPSWTQNRDDKG